MTLAETGTHYVVQAGLDFLTTPASTTRVLRFRGWLCHMRTTETGMGLKQTEGLLMMHRAEGKLSAVAEHVILRFVCVWGGCPFFTNTLLVLGLYLTHGKHQ